MSSAGGRPRERSLGSGVRIATHVFNTEEDLAKLFHAFDTLGVKPAQR
jgi:selenocysteine lyase/cysteine desulfurase